MRAFLLSLIFTTTLLTTTMAQNDWTLEKDKDGIKVWTKRRPNSKLKEYKGSVNINTTMDKLVSIMKNPKAYESFMYKCKPGSSIMLKKINDNNFYTYMIASAPIVKDRDIITHYVFTTDQNGVVTINIEADPDFIPVKSDYVRVPEMKGYWKLIPKGSNKVEVIHQAYSLTGGSIPDGLANSVSVDTPFYMLSNLKKLAE